jgi:hypothetical protein
LSVPAYEDSTLGEPGEGLLQGAYGIALSRRLYGDHEYGHAAHIDVLRAPAWQSALDVAMELVAKDRRVEWGRTAKISGLDASDQVRATGEVTTGGLNASVAESQDVLGGLEALFGLRRVPLALPLEAVSLGVAFRSVADRFDEGAELILRAKGLGMVD